MAFANLSADDKVKVLDFLNSLGRREFDMAPSLDNVILMDDFLGFADCFTGAGVPYEPTLNPMDHPCAVSDIDQDNDVDLDDFDSFLLVYGGPMGDCNSNGIVDLLDILNGTSTDGNGNGIPDSCEPTCGQDAQGDGEVSVNDLLVVMNLWGECPAVPAPCAADFNLDDVVDVDDLLAVINNWGPCQ
jgi:hypothetical protein